MQNRKKTVWFLSPNFPSICCPSKHVLRSKIESATISHRGPEFYFSSEFSFYAEWTNAKTGFVRADTTLDEKWDQVQPQFSTRKSKKLQMVALFSWQNMEFWPTVLLHASLLLLENFFFFSSSSNANADRKLSLLRKKIKEDSLWSPLEAEKSLVGVTNLRRSPICSWWQRLWLPCGKGQTDRLHHKQGQKGPRRKEGDDFEQSFLLWILMLYGFDGFQD